ncbi:GTP diphosphokinase, partial [Pseudidiomarina aestuarii]
KESLEAELAKINVPVGQAEQVLERFNMQHLDDLLAAIGAGDVRLHQVVNQLRPQTSASASAERLERLTARAKPAAKSGKAGKQSDVTVEGIGNLLVQFAKCCQPLPGEPIMGFVTQGRGVSVHRADCEQLEHILEQHPERGLAVRWSARESGNYRVDLTIDANDRTGLLHDITSILAHEKAAVVQLDSQLDSLSQQARIALGLIVDSNEALTRILGRL